MNVKPEFTASIAQLKSNTVLPATLLEKLAKENTTALGLVVKMNDKLEIEKLPVAEDAAKALSALNSIMENTKKYPRMFIFHEMKSEYDEDNDLQPYTLLRDSKGRPILCVCIEGDFPQYVDNEEGGSEAFMLVTNWLGPKIEDLYKTLGNNANKVCEYLRGQQFKADFKNAIGGGHRGVLSFMPLQGDQFTVEENTIGLVSDWGFVSNAYGYTESAVAAATPAKAEDPPPAGPKRSKFADPEPGPAAAPAAPTAPAPAAAPATDPASKAAAAVAPVKETLWSPPANIHGKALKELYRKMTGGTLPKDWKERPSVMVKVETSVKSLEDLAKTEIGMAAAKDMTQQAPKPVIPVLSAESMKRVNEQTQKILGDSSSVIADPVDANADEKMVAKFSETCLKSNNIEDVRRLPVAYFYTMGRSDPDALAMLAVELRTIARKYWDLIKNPEAIKALVNQAKASGTAEPPPVPATKPDDQVTVSPAEPQPAPTIVPAEPVTQPAARKRSKYA